MGAREDAGRRGWTGGRDGVQGEVEPPCATYEGGRVAVLASRSEGPWPNFFFVTVCYELGIIRGCYPFVKSMRELGDNHAESGCNFDVRHLIWKSVLSK
jgi:hypothetical protein